MNRQRGDKLRLTGRDAVRADIDHTVTFYLVVCRGVACLVVLGNTSIRLPVFFPIIDHVMVLTRLLSMVRAFWHS